MKWIIVPKCGEVNDFQEDFCPQRKCNGMEISGKNEMKNTLHLKYRGSYYVVFAPNKKGEP